MPGHHTEAAFEAGIEAYLTTSGGYAAGDRDTFDPERCIDRATFLAFVQDTQPEKWAYLETLQKDKAAQTLIDDLCRALDSEHEGCLSVLRHGFKCFGKLFRAAWFAPASGMNQEAGRRFAANVLTITRQVRYSPRHANALDVLLSLNGIPIVTAELKNPMTGQTWRNARHQYKHDRDPADLLFQFRKRTLVHFALDPDEVYVTTRLAGRNTHFLPFNRGCDGGAGNPENPDGWKTAYLWEEVLNRPSLLDILARFIHLQVEEKRLGSKKVKRETMIFPRYHQLDCVRALVRDAAERGAGANYLVQHSAGSGKSNSIAWLVHRLSTLHDARDDKVFDSVVVVTDRVVLDQQLQNTIYQFEHRQGVVQKIDRDSAQLAQALGAGVPIVVTTLQKFPFITEKIGDLPSRRYAVVIDEAHSSQGGETATDLKGVLGGAAIREQARQQAEAQGLTDHEEEILRTMARRGLTVRLRNAYYMWHRLTDHRLEVMLGPFSDAESAHVSDAESAHALTIFEKELGESLHPELRRQLIENSRGYPWLLKKLCIHIFDQVSSGGRQGDLRETLDAAALFDRDLQQLSQAQQACLKAIATSAPADWYEVLESYGAEVLRALQDRRLVVRSGDRINVYWDIFREYLLTKKTPAIPFYVCSFRAVVGRSLASGSTAVPRGNANPRRSCGDRIAR